MKREQDRDRQTDELLRRSLGSRTTGVSAGECLDADTTAALFDGALGSTERTRIEHHAAACARCQQLLASMARTHPSGARASVPAWWKRRPSLRWAVPLATAATAVALWVAVPDRRDDVPAAVAERAAGPSVVAPEPEHKQAPAAQASKAPAADTLGRAPGRPLRLDESDRQRAATQEMSADTGARAREPRSADAVAPPSGFERAAPAAAPPPAAAPMLLADRTAMKPVPEVASTDLATRWRIRGTDGVEVSSDGGQTWLLQPLAVAPSILTGSSPGPSVCWLAGRGGVVVKTVDGRTWEAVTSPDTADLVSITAASATEAVVATSDGRRFTTKDGGRTWTKTPLQENVAAPF